MRNTTAKRRGPARRTITTTLLAALLLGAAPWNGTASAETGDAPVRENPPVEAAEPAPEPAQPGTPPPETIEPPREPDTGERAERAWRKVVVDLSEQELTVHDQHGKVIVTWEISSGAPKTPTPVGRYRVTSKSRRTFATGNPEVTMEHMVRFKGGIGFHSIPRLRGTPMSTPLGERGVSHGCIRMADANARTLYRNLPMGAIVIVKP